MVLLTEANTHIKLHGIRLCSLGPETRIENDYGVVNVTSSHVKAVTIVPNK